MPLPRRQTLTLLLAPLVPWLLAVSTWLWPGDTLRAQHASAGVGQVCTALGFGMMAANYLWCKALTAQTRVPTCASKEP